MKILFLSNLYPPNVVGGYERLCFEAASGLSARGHEVTVLTSDYGAKVAEFPGQLVDRSLRLFASAADIYQPLACTPEERAAISAYNARRLETVVEQSRPDVIFVWNLFFLDPSFLQAIESTKRPAVYLLTDNWLISFLNAAFIRDYMGRLPSARVSAVRAAVRSARAWVANLATPGHTLDGHAIYASNFMRDLYAQARIRFTGRSTVVYHGVDLSPHQETEFIDRGQLIQQGKLRLLVAGRVVWLKGVHTALEALPAVMRALPGLDVELTVLGDDRDIAYKQDLCARITRLGLDKNVHFAPPVEEERLFHTFQDYDIYVFPSLYEPFSLTRIPALGAGIPTIASAVGGNPEIVHHSQTGMLFQAGNPAQLARAIAQLASDHARRRQISLSARAAVLNYTFRHQLDELERALEEIR